MRVNLSLMLCLLLAQSSQYPNLVNGENEKNATQAKPLQLLKIANNATANNVYQVKPITAQHQPVGQVQKSAEGSKEKVEAVVGTGKRRTITNTDNSVLAAAQAAAGNVTKPTASVSAAAAPVSATKPNLKQLAENVFLEANPQSANATLKSANSTITSAITNKDLSASKSSNVTKTLNNATIATTNSTLTTATNSSSSSTTITTSTTTTTTTTSTTTTTTTTPKPKKPTVTYGLEDFSHLDGEEKVNVTQQNGTRFPLPPPLETPNAEPSQESNSNFPYTNSRDYIVPIMTVLFTVPLAIGVVITTYRRFKDCWSTRHYQRMDFLVDGMYND